MANVNPGKSLNAATAAGAGASIDLSGAATGAAIPSVISLVVTCATFTTSYDASSVAAHAYATVGLEVSQDGTNWVRVGSVSVGAVTSGNRAQGTTASFPAEFARAVLDALDSRISSISVTAWVAGGT